MDLRGIVNGTRLPKNPLMGACIRERTAKEKRSMFKVCVKVCRHRRRS
jgi:hypothetical protein